MCLYWTHGDTQDAEVGSYALLQKKIGNLGATWRCLMVMSNLETHWAGIIIQFMGITSYVLGKVVNIDRPNGKTEERNREMNEHREEEEGMRNMCYLQFSA